MEFPIVENDVRIGTLRVSRDGLYTRFEAEIPAREGLQRLWLCGEKGAACLGLLTPEGEGLALRRRLSRAELKQLPAPLRYAALAAPEPAAEQPQPAASPPEPVKEPDGFRRVRLFGEKFVLY